MKKIKKWRNFIFEQNQINKLIYYIMDWDDNLLFMDTPIHAQHFENGKWISKDVSTKEFADIRTKYPDSYMDNIEWKFDQHYSFIEFRDFGPRGTNAFLEDVQTAIKNKHFGPSWEVFLKTMKEGRLFSIVTSRGHEPNTIKDTVKYIIETCFTPEEKLEMNKNLMNFNNIFGVVTDNVVNQYLNSCYFMGLMSDAFVEEFHYTPVGVKMNQGKQDAINKFVNFVRSFSQRTKLPLKVGFSDDDKGFSDSAKELFMNLEKSLDFPENFYVFDTSTKRKGGIKTKY